MEIQALRATVTEQDLNDLAARLPAEGMPVEELRFAITDQGVVVKGEYPLLVTVAFEMLWELGVQGGKVVARLARLKTLGMPMGILKSAVMGMISARAKSEPWLAVEKDTVVVDLERALAGEGVKARLNVTAVRCTAGVVTIEAGQLT
jgi:hypothetical protein